MQSVAHSLIVTIDAGRESLPLGHVEERNMGNKVFRDYFQIPTQIHNTRQADHISKDQINTEYGRSTTHFTGASLWNKLPIELKNSPSINSLKNKTKKFIKENPQIFSNIFIGP